MIADLKPYPAMKDSGMPWLGKVPVHWEVRRNGRLFAQRNQSGFPSLPILEVSLRTGVRVRDFEASNRKQVMSDRANYKRACKGDITYNMMRMWQGAVGVAPVEGLVSPAYVVARPFPETGAEYFQLVFRTDAYMNEINKSSRGIVSDRNRLYWEDFKQMSSPFPSHDEQSSIVRFLSHADRQIRRYVRAKKQLITFLDEQKAAVIHHAVTRGLDPRVRLRPSGVELLGDVPAHWEVRRLGNVTEMRVSNVDKLTKDDEQRVRLCNYVDVYRNDRIRSAMPFMQASATVEEIERFRLVSGDVLITKDSESWNDIGVPAFVEDAADDLVCGYHLALLRPFRERLRGDFLFRALQSKAVAYQFHVEANGVTRYGLTQSAIKSIWVPVPPLDEQTVIVQFLHRAVAVSSAAIERARYEIALLREYRTRLIADVVAGKLDVREVAARLPDEAEEPGPPNETETLNDAEADLADNLETAEEEAEA